MIDADIDPLLISDAELPPDVRRVLTRWKQYRRSANVVVQANTLRDLLDVSGWDLDIIIQRGWCAAAHAHRLLELIKSPPALSLLDLGIPESYLSSFVFGADPCVYLVRSEGKQQTLHKIGQTISFRRRVENFKTNNPHITRIWSLGPIPSGVTAYGIEQRLHAHFHSKRVCGEWFNLTSDDVKMLEALGFRTGTLD